MSADIYRYLNDEPIAARPPSALYQLRKFAKRHRSLIVGAAAVAAALVLGAVVSVLFAVGQSRARADAEHAGLVAEARRVEAERQASIAAAVNQFLNEDLLAAADPAAEGREVTVLEVLDLASEELRDRFPDEPLVRASLHSTIGGTYLKLGELENAEPHLTEALALRREQLGAEHQDTLESMDRLARYLRLVGEEDQAESLYSQVLETRRRLLGPSDRLTVAAMQNLGSLYRVRGRTQKPARSSRRRWRWDGPISKKTMYFSWTSRKTWPVSTKMLRSTTRPFRSMSRQWPAGAGCRTSRRCCGR